MADAIVLITTQADKVSEAAKKIVEIPVGTQTLMAFRTYSREDDLAAFDLGGD